MNITPTRMELYKLCKKLKTSQDGYKLLKDKQDELIRRFIALINKTNELRGKVNQGIRELSEEAGLSVAGFPYEMIQNLFLLKENVISSDINHKTYLGVPVVQIDYKLLNQKPSSVLVSSPLLSKTESDMRELLPSLLELTMSEKNCCFLSKEIESLRRRVNALEHMIIPQLERDIKIIKMKLSDGERETTTRLIKLKNNL